MLEVVLAHAREAAGAERAFLLEASPTPHRPRLVARSVDDAARAATYSRSVALRALRGDRLLFWADMRRHAAWADGASVRALELHSALASPVPGDGDARAALVLDSRRPMTLDGGVGETLVRGFAGVLGILRRGARPSVSAETGPGLVGRSAVFLSLVRDVEAMAAVPLPALILGESGTGKELVARRLHDAGPRSARPFVAINCAAIPETLLERELFGAARGAFTGADRDHPGLLRRADGGTVLLDEIGDMPLTLQAKLLRVLQERRVRAVGALEEQPVDVRVVSATHRDLTRLVTAGRFRADLRYRLEVLVLRVPPLRERREDLPLLAAHLLERLASRCRMPVPRLDHATAARLSAHRWPGNIRELESVLARALIRARHGTITVRDLDFGVDDAPCLKPSDAAELERAMIAATLAETRGNVTAAAERLGWWRQTLYRKMRALGLGPLPDAGAPKADQVDSEGGGTKSSDSSTFQ
jgi:two-component system NtrC family response regulator